MNRNRNPKASHVRWLSATVLVVVLMLGMAPGVGAAGGRGMCQPPATTVTIVLHQRPPV